MGRARERPGAPEGTAAERTPSGMPMSDFRTLRRRLAALGADSPDSEAWAMLEAATGRSRIELLTDAPSDDPEVAERLEAYLARREAGAPLQHVLARAWFWGLPLQVGPGVLVPRPETERLVELALQRLQGRVRPRVLDVGTGSGAIALALAHERPDAKVWASDADPEALAMARRNAQRLELSVSFAEGDLLAATGLADLLPKLDLLVSNPPYLPEADREHLPPEVRRDPAGALFAGGDGLEVWRRLEAQARDALPKGSMVLVELDPRNVRDAAEAATGWIRTAVHDDLAGRPRILELTR